MKLTRFSFGETGIFHALPLLEDCLEPADYEDMKWAERQFDKLLTIPEIVEKEKTSSFFTPKGIQKFQEPLEILRDLFYQIEEFGIGTFEQKIVNYKEVKNLVIYEDEFQVILKEERKV